MCSKEVRPFRRSRLSYKARENFHHIHDRAGLRMWCTRTIRNDDHRREQRTDSCFLLRLCCILLAVGTDDHRREQRTDSCFLILRLCCILNVGTEDHRREQRTDSCFLLRLCCILLDVGTDHMSHRRDKCKNSSFLVLVYHIPMLRTLFHI